MKCKHGIDKYEVCKECNKEWGYIEHDHDEEPIYSEEIEIITYEDDGVAE